MTRSGQLLKGPVPGRDDGEAPHVPPRREFNPRSLRVDAGPVAALKINSRL